MKLKAFSTKVTISTLLIVFFFFIVIIGAVSWTSNKIVVEDAKRNACDLLASGVNEINQPMRVIEMKVKMLAEIVKGIQDDDQALYDLTKRMILGENNIVGSAIAFPSMAHHGQHFFSPYTCVDSVGNIIQKQLGTPTYNYFDMEWYRVPTQRRKPTWSEPYYDKEGGEMLITTYSYPIYDYKNGELIAVLTADVTLSWISGITSKIHPYESSITLLLSQSKQYIGIQEESTLTDEEHEIVGQIREHAMQFTSDGIMAFETQKGKCYLAQKRLPNGWTALLLCPYDEIMARSRWLIINVLVVSLLGMIAIYLATHHIIHRITKPLTQFTESANNISRGNIMAELPHINSNDEIRQLHDAFQNMQVSLKSQIEEVQRATATQQRIASEMHIAQGIQLGMLPTNFPTTSKLDIYASMSSAKEVGGDMYDFMQEGDNLYFAIGDVSGKGVPAALFMTITRALCRIVSGLSGSADNAMFRINNFLCGINSMEMFVTMFIGRINLRTGHMVYCNAGHNPIIIIQPNGEASFLKAKPNFIVGLYENYIYVQEELNLQPGTRLILYTDGINEAENKEQEIFGNQRLLQWSQDLPPNASAKNAVDSLLSAVKAFTADNPQNDDITIMAIDFLRMLGDEPTNIPEDNEKH